MAGSAGRVLVATPVAATRLAMSSMHVGDAEFLVAERLRRISSGHLHVAAHRWLLLRQPVLEAVAACVGGPDAEELRLVVDDLATVRIRTAT